MSNSINVTKCDNELILIAYQWGASFELARILSGNYNSLDVTLDIEAGAYQGGVIVNGVNHPIPPSTHYLYLQPGEYTLVAIGIDWGGPQEFSFTFNGETYALPQNKNPTPDSGVVWTPSPISFTIPAS
ncbi:hypothetical protein KO507_09820 [Gilvimarinus agarilyticus]|uniref:Uncharacterized protein n=1 Tax=Reichenbachiella agariperforans TaxID=156994 RepID=A0A1M6KFI4_REIAG|nr:hypothetical protein [Reichenbachiella agariperforans]MBU2886057.1 hypothetical protein [Gilvimarinus agarilyticus]SHJ57704.1 hypothetical protein SAMN04488028_101558 [Reichenbachiella agariperforans]